jgi:hypothetical protein
MVINFESERLKRSDYQNVCEDLLEKLLYAFCPSDGETEKEDFLKTFLKELDLGSTPLTHLVRTYFSSPDAQFSADNILKEISLPVLGNIVEFIEGCWPQEKLLIKKLKVLLIGFGLKKLKIKDSFWSSLGNSSIIEHIEDYLLGKDDTLEIEILSPPSNVLPFPSLYRVEGSTI